MSSLTVGAASVGARNSSGTMSISFSFSGQSDQGKTRIKVDGSVKKTVSSGVCSGSFSGSETSWKGGSKSYTVTGEGAIPQSEAWTQYASKSVTASWSAAQFTVTFDDNYTGGSTSTKTETYDSTWVFPSDPTRTGYSFAGWNTATDGTGTSYAPGDTVAITSNITLYAQWTAQSILHAVTGGDAKTITNIKVVDNGTVRDIIGCYSVKNGDVHQGV